MRDVEKALNKLMESQSINKSDCLAEYIIHPYSGACIAFLSSYCPKSKSSRGLFNRLTMT